MWPGPCNSCQSTPRRTRELNCHRISKRCKNSSRNKKFKIPNCSIKGLGLRSPVESPYRKWMIFKPLTTKNLGNRKTFRWNPFHFWKSPQVLKLFKLSKRCNLWSSSPTLTPKGWKQALLSSILLQQIWLLWVKNQ